MSRCSTISSLERALSCDLRSFSLGRTVRPSPRPSLQRQLSPQRSRKRYSSTQRKPTEYNHISPMSDNSISFPYSHWTPQHSMFQRDPDGNWIPDGTRASLVKERRELNTQPNDLDLALSAPALGSFSLDDSFLATAPYEPQFDTSQVGASHVEYVTWHLEQHYGQAQQIQEQVHQGPFYPTRPKHRHQPQQPPRTAPIIPQGFQPQTNPQRGGKQAKRKFRKADAIVAPSAASGGVPEPTPSYLLRASFLPRSLPDPQPLLVVIDLNGTLVHRPSHKNPRHIQPRPFASEFLRYCIDTFHVMIWSSARPANVAAMCEKLLGADQLRRAVAVWGRDRFGLSAEDYDRRVQCYKRLSRVWSDPVVQATYPPDYDDAGRKIEGDDHGEDESGRIRKPGSWNQGNTVLIDDSREKARSEPHNAVEIPEFLGGRETEEVLPRVHDYLNTLACQADVSTYIRVHPFKPVENH